MLSHPRTLPAGFIAPCLLSSAPQAPSGEEWLHEIKHDGFRVIARKDGTRVKLYSRPGNDLTDRFPLIVEALAKLRPRSCIIDDLNNLGVPTPHIFATPLKVGIYMFTTDSGQLGYGASGLNNSNALSTTTDLGWMKIDIDPSAQVTKFGLLVGLPGPQKHNHEAVLFFDNYNHLLGGTGVSRGGGFRFVAFENTEGLIGRVVIQDADLNSSSFVVDNLVSQSGRP
jgi:hypothetical protein